jgi:hypothetical protein
LERKNRFTGKDEYVIKIRLVILNIPAARKMIHRKVLLIYLEVPVLALWAALARLRGNQPRRNERQPA